MKLTDVGLFVGNIVGARLGLADEEDCGWGVATSAVGVLLGFPVVDMNGEKLGDKVLTSSDIVLVQAR